MIEFGANGDGTSKRANRGLSRAKAFMMPLYYTLIRYK